jgi:hypothetical protein
MLAESTRTDWRRAMKKLSTLLLAGALLLAGFGLVELARADHDGDLSVIHSCSNRNTGRLRVLSTGESCNPQTERGITWPSLSGVIRRGAAGTAFPSRLFFFSSFMNTVDGVRDIPFGQAKLQTTGTAGQFKVCTNTTATVGAFNFVVYVNGTRTAGSLNLAGSGSCSQVFDVGAGGDFQVSIRRVQIFGVHSGDGTSNENYSLIGFGQEP